MPANTAEYQRNYRSLRKEERKDEMLILLKILEELKSLRKKLESFPPIPPLGFSLDSLPNPPLIPPSNSQPSFFQVPPSKSKKESKGPPTRGVVSEVRGKRLASDWWPSESEREFAVSRGVDPDTQAECFRDYWHAKAGADACKRDWTATWRNWVRRAPKKPQPSNPNGSFLSSHQPKFGPLRDPVELWDEINKNA